jgi:outer membrane protein insertion porin family
MNSRIFHAFSLIAFTCSIPTLSLDASSPSYAYEERKVAKIDVIVENLGARESFNPQIVINRLKTKVGARFSQFTFDSDLKMLSEQYDRVEPEVEIQGGDIVITLRLWERPIIHQIIWQGNTLIKTKTLESELGIKPHTTFYRQEFNKSFNKVKEYYIKQGYFESQLSYSIQRIPHTNQVDIIIDITEGRSGKIGHLILTGFTKTERQDIYSMIQTKKYNFFTSWLTGTGKLNEDAVEQDRLIILDYLQNRGYPDAKVSIEVREMPKTLGKVEVEILADRGELYHFGTIRFTGNTLFSNDVVDKAFTARPGQIYSLEKLRHSVENIKELYGRKGYIDTIVRFDTTPEPNKHIYNVVFHIEESPQYKIGIIRIFGNVRTKDNVILRESLLIPGETFDLAKLKTTQRRLEAIGYFKSVNVYAVKTSEDESLGDNYRDVYIEVDETQTGTASVFLSFSSADKLFGGLDYSETNFNIKGIPAVFKEGYSAVRGAGEYANAKISLGERISNFTFSWVDPYLNDTPWRLATDISLTRNNLPSESYSMYTYGFTVAASYPLTSFWTFGMKYKFHDDQATTRKHSKNKRQDPEQQAAHQTGVVSSFGPFITFDSTDSARKPHNGLRSMLEAEFAGLGGPFTFFRFGFFNSYYTQLWSKGVMKYRGDFRFIEPVWKTPSPKDIPLNERFFIGGLNSVRGYRDFDLGGHFSDGSPTGGTSATIFSIEYQQEVIPIADLFVFFDAGSIALKRFYFANFRFSSGLGTRLQINRIPVILGYGIPINRSRHAKTRHVFFSMGGQF